MKVIVKRLTTRWTSRCAITALALIFALLTPAITLAGMVGNDEDTVTHDARIENYTAKVLMDGGSTALMWFLLALLAAVCVGVMFKSANRSHLD